MNPFRAALALLLLGVFGDLSHAALAYVITQNSSQLDLSVSGTAFGGALNVTEQHPTAITRYNGTIITSFPNGASAGGSIAFPGGGSANAVNPTGILNIPRQYSPNIGGGGGSAPANYGVNLNAPIGIPIPPIEIPDLITLNLGTLQSINVAVALRDLALDLGSASPIAIGPGGVFDSNGFDLTIAGGFADVNGALVFQQDNLLDHFAAVIGLNALVLAIPDLGATVSSNTLARTVSLGFGTRQDLSGIGGLSVANTAATPGSVSFVDSNTLSTLILPISLDLPLDGLGIPADILTLDLSLNGQLQATAFIPEPSTLWLSAVGLIGVGCAGIHHRRRTLKKVPADELATV